MKSRQGPGVFSLIFNGLRDMRRRRLQIKSIAAAREYLERGDPAPMERLRDASVGDVWLALADFYRDHRPGDAVLVTEAYRMAAQCKVWFNRSDRVEREYDRRRFLGIGVAKDFHALAKEWKGWHFPGYQRETQLAWIATHGPAELRDLKEGWWWVAVAEARWSRLEDVGLPVGSAEELRGHLENTVSEKDRCRLQAKAKDYARAEFISGK